MTFGPVGSNFVGNGDCEKDVKWFQILAIVIMSFSCLTVGALFTWTSPSIPILISDEFPGNITMEEASYLTVIPPLAAIIGSLLFSSIMDKIGRKKALLFMGIPQIISWLIIIFSKSIYLLYLSRAFNGLADGCMFTVLPTYMSEITIPSVRGLWGNLPTISIYFGQFLINVIGGYCTIRTTAYIFLVLPILFLLSFPFMPESPYYLIMKSNPEDARRSLQKLRQKENVEDELKSLTNDVHRQISESGKWKDLFTHATHRKAFWAGVFIRGAQQLSGLAAFSAHTVYLFQQAGTNLSPTVCAMIFTFLLFAMDGIGSLTLDKLGRKMAMVVSCAGCSIMLLSQAVFFYLKNVFGVDVSIVSWFPIAGMFMYIIIFGIGLGIVPTLIIGELFSASIKAKGVCALNIVFSLYMCFTTKIFQLLTDNFGVQTPFLLFGIFCACSTYLSYHIVPETKGKTLEEIQQSMRTEDISSGKSKVDSTGI